MSHPLIIVYGALSRFDQAQTPPAPFSGAAGDLFLHRTVDVEPKPTSVDVRVVGTRDMLRPWTPGARVLLLGAKALNHIQPGDDDLLKNRGLILTAPNNLPAIATFSPIECWDFKHEEDDEDDDDDKEDAKDVGPTSRSNYLHWTLLDYRKLMSIPWPLDPILSNSQPCNIANDAGRVINWLNNIHDTYCIIDIETRRNDHSLDCIGFRAHGVTVVVPIYRHNNQLYFSVVETAKIWRAILQLFLRKGVTIVGHNLGFDLAVLSLHYHLPIPNAVYDTMLAMHREYPQLEKSLSHALGVYTLARRNHKADIASNTTYERSQQLFTYNGNDVLWTERIYLEQLRRAAAVPHLAAAVALANKLLRSTLITSNTGTVVDIDTIAIQQARTRRAAEQYERICKILSGNPNFNPGSPPQCVDLFYTQLKYPIEDMTKTGAPAAGTKTLYKLAVKQPNPLIPLIVAAREARKANSILKFRTRHTNK